MNELKKERVGEQIMGEKENVKTLEKALIIMEKLGEVREPLGVNELSRLCSVNAATACRILKTLKSRGWVYQDKNERYIVGYRLSLASEKHNFHLMIKEVSYYVMSRLSAQASQAMNLVVRENEKCYILQQSRTDRIVDYVPPIGTILPIYASASGKVLLSELSDDKRREILNMNELRPLTANTITDIDVLLSELEKVRQSGFAVDAHETQENGFCVSVPLRSKEGDIIAALSFAGIIGNVTDDDIERYVQMLKAASSEITERIYTQL